MSNFIVGLTGGIGSGKTTVANIFAAYGVTLIDADIIARDIVKPQTPALVKIVERFGNNYLGADGYLDRAKLREKVFNDSTAKQWLNNLLHPLIRSTIVKELSAAKSAYCLLIAPLLIENKLTHYVNRVLVVDVDEKTQLTRAMLRDNNSQTLIKNIMKSQLPRQERLAVADDIIDNTVALDKVHKQVEKLHQFYLNLASTK